MKNILTTWIVILLMYGVAQGQVSPDLSRVQVYLHFNQDKYFPGDTAFFKAYFLDNVNHKIPGKQILQFRLTDYRGKVVAGFQFIILNGLGYNQVVLPVDLPSGHYQAVAYSQWMLNFEPPQYFSKTLSVVRDRKPVKSLAEDDNIPLGNVVVEITSSRPCYRVREQVDLDIFLQQPDGKAVSGEFVVGVQNRSVLPDQPRGSIVQTLASDAVSGQNPASTRFDFQQLITRYGRAIAEGAPVPTGTRIMFYLQQNKMRYETEVLFQGRFKLEMLDFYGEDELLFVAHREGEAIDGVTINWDQDSVELPQAPPFVEMEGTDPFAVFMRNKRRIDRSFRAFGDLSIPENTTAANKTIEGLLGGAGVVINFEEYVMFPTMKEFLKEVVRNLYVGKRGDRNIVTVKYLQPQMATGEPLYVVDGIATLNTDFFLSIPPASVLTLKIIKDPRKRARFGFLGRNGIVMVETRNGDVREQAMDLSSRVKGLSKPIRFLGPTEVRDRRTPDFRSTVYWNPLVRTDSEGKARLSFYTSDDIGHFLIRIEGLTDYGEPFVAQTEIEVALEEE